LPEPVPVPGVDSTIFHRGLGEPEGPVLLDDGNWVVVEMSPATGHVSVISADGASKRVVVITGRPNGMVRDSQGTLWVAESINPQSLLRVELDGSSDVVLTEGDGAEFLFPNDLAFGPDGALYMTDSGVRQQDFLGVPVAEKAGYPFDRKVFRIDQKNMAVTILDEGLGFANGLAFGKDRALYVTTAANGLVYRYEWTGDGTPGSPLGPRKEFADLVDRSGASGLAGFVGGDGLAVATSGDLYCTVVGQGDVTVIDASGEVVRRISVGGIQPTNVAFGREGTGDIYVTVKDAGTLERHHVGIDGLPLLPSA
jgi:gluconolactonase